MLRITDILREGWRAVAAALLLVIGVHAAVPVGQPLQRQAGSAFSAATADVSLSQVRREHASRWQAQRHAPPLLAIRSAAAGNPAQAAVTGARFALYDANAPPSARASFYPLAPRAPPAA